MKKLLVLMGLAAAAFSFTGCQKNEMKDADNGFKGTSTFELVADIAQTKTTLDPDYAVDWEEGDLIYMVTSDGTWGAPYADDKDAKTIAEFKYADGKFATTSTIGNGTYIFKAMYAREDQKSYHRGTSTTHKLEVVQAQDCDAPTAHIKANDALVGTFTATIPMEEVAKVKMAHLYTLMQVDVKNSTGADIEVTKFEMTAAGADLAGVFNVESFETPSISTKSGASSTITVNVANGEVKAGESLPVYFVMAPLADYSGDVTFKVTDASGNTYTKTATPKNNMTFAAGKYNTTPYTISSADVVEPEPANVTWDLSINETSEVSETKIAWTSDFAEMYCEKGGASTPTNNYYGGNDDNRTSTRFYTNSILTIAPKAGYKITSVVFTATTKAYASALSGSTWTNASATVNSEVVTVTPTNGAQSVTATIGGTCGFTSVVVYYAENEGGEEPETKTLVSITISGQTTTYTVGDTFEFDGTVTATYSDGTTATVTPTSVSEPDMDVEGTKDVTVTYTEGGVTKEITYQINVSAADNTDYSGTYAIVAYRNSESLYYYLTNEQTSSSTVRLVAKSAGNTRPAEDVTLNASKLWNVSKSGSVYTIQSVASNKYVSWESGNSAIMSETGLQFTVTKQDGTFNFINGDRYLSLNSAKGSDYFAMYAGTQTQNLYLIKAVEGEEPAPTLTGIKVEGQTTTFTVGDTFKFDGTVTATYSDFTTADVTDYATFSGYDMSSAGDQKVTVSYDGKTCEYPITVKEASTGGDNENTETKYYVKVTSAPTDWSGTYLIVYEDGKIAFDGNLTTLDAVKNTVDVTIEDGKIEATDAMKARQFTINASGHIQSASGYYIGQTSDTNGLKSNKTTSYTNTFSLNTDGTVNVVSGGAYLRYNATSGQERFRYYKSSSYTGQEAISLYKLQ